MTGGLGERPSAAVGAQRVEHDALGELAVPGDADYGIHTARAVANFPVSGTPVSRHPGLVNALVAVKRACATANEELGLLDSRRAQAIVWACDEIAAGRQHDQFVVDVLQGGAGTSTNMNANEVIANLALRRLGHERGRYDLLHPLEHVNAGQSTNDVYPTAARIALFLAVPGLTRALAHLREAFELKAAEYTDALKMGRTQLQDAVPMTLGQELGAYAAVLASEERQLRETAERLLEVNLGGTAIGTGLNAPPLFPATATRHLRAVTGLALVTADDLVAATWDTGVFVALSGALRRSAVALSKIAGDLRLLTSGPRTGFGDLTLPPVQAGSSIMPGKVNPVVPEMVNQVAFVVIGHDLTVTLAAGAGQLQLNAFEPVIVHSLLEGIGLLGTASTLLADRCVTGIGTDRARLRARVEQSAGLATALVPHMGYEASSALVAEALATGSSVHDLALRRGLLTPEQVREQLAPGRMADATSSHR